MQVLCCNLGMNNQIIDEQVIVMPASLSKVNDLSNLISTLQQMVQQIVRIVTVLYP